MNSKRQARIRRCRKIRAKIKMAGKLRLSVFRTSRHIYAQIIDAEGGVKASAASVEKEFRGDMMGNIEGSRIIGRLVAERAKKAGVAEVVFDRSGFKYHGRVRALADAAREMGLKF